MTYGEKIQKARDTISAHNEKTERKISVDDFLRKLEADGGTSDEALQQTSWEDLERYGLPRLLAKQVVVVFRVKNGSERPKYFTEARVQTMTIEELLGSYDAQDATNFVGKRLFALSKGLPCIVFDVAGQVNVAASSVLVKELKEGFPPRETFKVDGRPCRLYKVGERPDLYADENPLYPGRILRPDGTCDQTNRSWDGVLQDVRVLLYLAVSATRELVISRLDDAHVALDLALSEGAEKKLRERYQQASIEYDRLQKEGALPTLKKALASVSGRRNDPFFAEHRRV